VLRDERSIADANCADAGRASASNAPAPMRHAASRESSDEVIDCDPFDPFDPFDMRGLRGLRRCGVQTTDSAFGTGAPCLTFAAEPSQCNARSRDTGMVGTNRT
jgi:hypothetical protein